MQVTETRNRVFQAYYTATSGSTYKTLGFTYDPTGPADQQLMEQRFMTAYYNNQYYYYSSTLTTQVVTSSIKVGPSDLNNVKVGHWVEWSGTVANPTGTHIVRTSASSVLALGLVLSITNNTASVLKQGYVYDPAIIGYQTSTTGDANMSFTLYRAGAGYGSSSTEEIEGTPIFGSVTPSYADNGSTVAILYVNPIAGV